MPKFRKKPVIIEAIQWTGENTEKILAFIGRAAFLHHDDLYIRTLEGDMRAGLGWWVIRGVKGEFYPCERDIFELTYEAVGEEVE